MGLSRTAYDGCLLQKYLERPWSKTGKICGLNFLLGSLEGVKNRGDIQSNFMSQQDCTKFYCEACSSNLQIWRGGSNASIYSLEHQESRSDDGGEEEDVG